MVTILKYSNGSRTSFLSNDVICIPKPVDRKIILPRVITLPHFPLHVGEAIFRSFPG